MRLDATDEHYTKVAERFSVAMPNASIMSIERVENVGVYERYFEIRTSIAYRFRTSPSFSLPVPAHRHICVRVYVCVGACVLILKDGILIDFQQSRRQSE